MSVELAISDQDIRDCFPVVRQLRTHITNVDEFAEQVRRQQSDGYQLVFIKTDGRVVAAAGFRCSEFLAWGKALYVDDLVTGDATRSRGYGRELMDWLKEFAQSHGCHELHLDSGVQRFEAHRFYLRERLNITSHHFAIKLAPKS